jgi:hypothetical protein
MKKEIYGKERRSAYCTGMGGFVVGHDTSETAENPFIGFKTMNL